MSWELFSLLSTYLQQRDGLHNRPDRVLPSKSDVSGFHCKTGNTFSVIACLQVHQHENWHPDCSVQHTPAQYFVAIPVYDNHLVKKTLRHGDVTYSTLDFKVEEGKKFRRFQYITIVDTTRIRALKIYEWHTQQYAINFVDYLLCIRTTILVVI